MQAVKLLGRRGVGDAVTGTTVYVILVVLFTIGLFFIIVQHKNNVANWEEFYAKEFALLLDQARPGDRYTIDVQHAAERAVKNGVGNPNYIIRFDGKTHEVVVALRKNGETRFSYFSDVVVSDMRMEIGRPGTVLHFTVAAAPEGTA